MEGDNQLITLDECEFIRGLEDFDMIMLLSEIHDHGWPFAKKLLPMMRGDFEGPTSKDTK